MPPRKRPLRKVRPDPLRRRRRLAIGVGAVGIVSLVVSFLFGPGVLAILARRMAARQMDRWAISAAQQWLARAAWLDPGDGEVELMRAARYRRWGQIDRWREAMERAEQMGVPPTRIQQEIQLAAIRSGQLRAEVEQRHAELIEAGASPQDVGTAVLDCYLAYGEYRKAEAFLENWEAEYAGNAHVAYLWGFYLLRMEEFELARTRFEEALAKQPRHELARKMSAELFETQNRLDRALEQHSESVALSPASTVAKLGLARVLRRLNRTSEARDLLAPLASDPEPLLLVVLEMGQLELEAGNYQEAERWFARADFDQEREPEELLPAAIVSTLVGNPTRAERLFARYDAIGIASVRAYDLSVRLAIDPRDRQAADELKRVLSQPTGTAADLGPSEREPTGEVGPNGSVASAGELYARHCSACHGASGSGDGRAARHLYPSPQDLGTGKFRLASTVNGVPTLEDLEAVVKQGMPGTSMPSFENLSESQRKLLAREAFRLFREGFRGRFIRMLSSEGEEIDEDEVREVIEQCTTPGEVVSVPQIGPPDSQAIARGKDTYFHLGCHHCHGDDGIGAPDMFLFDDEGRPRRARDLVHEPFKGGQEPESIYLRIYLGMPGTPQPACWNVSQERLIDLVHYCRWLSREPKLVLTNHQRAIHAASNAYRSAFIGAR